MKLEINIKNPIISSVLCIIITFIVTIIVLTVAKPSYITEISNKGKKKINLCLLFFISLLFGILVGLAKLLFFSEKTSTSYVKNKFAYNPITYKP